MWYQAPAADVYVMENSNLAESSLASGDVIHHKNFSIRYPVAWEQEYRETGNVSVWMQECPELFHEYLDGNGRFKLDTTSLVLFAQYALMYLLHEREGARSITWLDVAGDYKQELPRNKQRRLNNRDIMGRCMGDSSFNRLHRILIEGGLGGWKGEPDLFCWRPDGAWFFAEAKGKGDKLAPAQYEWFRLCQQALDSKADLRVYEVLPSLEVVT
jgi:hypothetical protein